MASLPTLSTSPEHVSVDGFRHKSKKSRSAAKRASVSFEYRTCFNLNFESAGGSNQEDRATATPPRKKISKSQSGEKISLREARAKTRFKPVTSIDLNMFYRRNLRRSPINSSDLLSIDHGYLLFKEKGKKPKKRWITLTDKTLLCYKAIVVCFISF